MKSNAPDEARTRRSSGSEIARPAAARPTPESPEPLRWWHIGQLADLEQTLFPGDSPWTAEMFWAELAAGNFYLAAVNDDAQVIGYAGMVIRKDEAEVQTIGVRPADQGRGLGRNLLSALLSEAGIRRVLLDVRTDNKPAIKLYESVGFVVIGIRRRYYQPSGADAYTMERTCDI